MPPLSITMSSSIAAATAMPGSESAVRSGAGGGSEPPGHAPHPRPQRTIGGVRTRRQAAAAPAAMPSTSESDDAEEHDVRRDDREGEGGVEESAVVRIGGGASQKATTDADRAGDRHQGRLG